MTEPQTLDNNGSYASLVVNTGAHRRLPAILNTFLDEYSRENNKLVHFLRVLTHDNVIPNTDQLHTILFTIDVAVEHHIFEEYIDAIVDNDLIPFLIGCKVTPQELSYQYVIPELHKHICTAGEYGVVIYTNELSFCLKQILEDCFDKSYEYITHAEGVLGNYGQLKIHKCIREENRQKFDYIMTKFGIKYELYK